MAETVIADDGTELPLASLPMGFTYDGSGNVETASVVYANQSGIETTYVQTFTYTGADVTSISRWEAQ